MAERLNVQPGDGVVAVTLTCWSGLYIRGRVLDSSGEGDKAAYLRVQSPDVFCDVVCDDRAGAEGRFEAGPFVPGEYTLVAETWQGTDGDSAPVVARAGDDNVELRLSAAGSVVALVLDEQGQPAEAAEMYLMSSQDESEGRGTWETDAEGRVAFFGVAPGRYALVARRGASIGLGLAHVEQAGAAGAELRILLEAGVSLVVASPQAKRQLGYRVRHGGWMISTGFFGPGEESSMLAPPGDIQVELLSWGKDGKIGVAETRTVTAGAGQQIRVEFDAPAAPR